MWTRYFFEEIDKPSTGPSILYMDSDSAKKIVINPEKQTTMKHVHRNYHWIREKVEQKLIKVEHVAGARNPADIFTKPLQKTLFERFRDMLGVKYIAPPTPDS